MLAMMHQYTFTYVPRPLYTTYLHIARLAGQHRLVTLKADKSGAVSPVGITLLSSAESQAERAVEEEELARVCQTADPLVSVVALADRGIQ